MDGYGALEEGEMIYQALQHMEYQAWLEERGDEPIEPPTEEQLLSLFSSEV